MCNYTFEYDRAPGDGAPARASTPMVGVVLACTVVAAIATYVLAAPSIGATPDRHAETGYFLLPIGAFSTAGAMFGWRWFFSARRARFVVTVLGLAGARIFYALLGGVLVGIGSALLVA